MSQSPRGSPRSVRAVKANIKALEKSLEKFRKNIKYYEPMNRIISWNRFYYGYERNKQRLINELGKAAIVEVQRKFKQAYYEPHTPSSGKRSPLRGRGFRRTARSVMTRNMSPKARAEANLKNQLARMLSAYRAKRNRENIKKMFNAMQNTWRNTGYSKKGGEYVNAAQTIMWSSGFI